MFTVFEGQITYSGNLADALRMIIACKTVRHGVLRITSDKASGLVGIFCGRYVTGAVTMLAGDTKYGALSRLLFVTDGAFAFLDAVDEPLQDLKQGLAVDVQSIIDALDQQVEDLVISPDSLVTMAGQGEELQLFDTSAGEEEGQEKARVTRLKATYQRLLSISEQEKVMRGQPIDDEYGSAVHVTEYGRERISVVVEEEPLRVNPSPVDTATMQPQSPSLQVMDQGPASRPSVKRGQFKRLDRWEHDAKRLAIFFWIAFVVIVLGAMFWYRDALFR